MSAAPRIQLAGVHDPRSANAYTTLITNGKGQRFVNWIPHKIVNPITGKVTFKLEKRPGYASALAIVSGASTCTGLFWSSHQLALLVTFGGTAVTTYKVAVSAGALTATAIGNLTETSATGERIFSEYDQNTVVSAQQGVGAYFTAAWAAWTQISDAQFPGALVQPPLVHMDGWTFALSAGVISNSDINSLTSWTAGNSITPTLFQGGTGLRIAKAGSKILYFMDQGTQVLYNAGNATGSPLSTIPNQAFPIGLYEFNNGSVTVTALTAVDDKVYWVGRTTRGGIGVYGYSAAGVEKISSPEVEMIIGSLSAPRFTLNACSLYGRTLLVLLEVATDFTLVCSLTDKVWFEWAKASGGAAYWRFMVQAQFSPTTEDTPNQIFGANAANGTTIYRMPIQTPVYQDVGNTYTATAQTDPLDFGSDLRKFFGDMRVIGDTEASTSNLGVSYSDDDCVTYSTARNVDMSSADKRLPRLGSTPHTRSFRLTHSANTPCRLEALEFPLLEVGEP